VNERRSTMQVVVDVLRVIERENSVKPTHILYKANLSHKLLKEYLNTLLQKGLIEVVIEKNHTYYKITDKGRNFMIEFRKIEKLAQVFGLPV
jgi:predicted transcriptional regulator